MCMWTHTKRVHHECCALVMTLHINKFSWQMLPWLQENKKLLTLMNLEMVAMAPLFDYRCPSNDACP